MARDVSPTEELILIFVAKSHVWAQRILLMYAIDAGRIMNFGPTRSSASVTTLYLGHWKTGTPYERCTLRSRPGAYLIRTAFG